MVSNANGDRPDIGFLKKNGRDVFGDTCIFIPDVKEFFMSVYTAGIMHK